MTRKKLAGLLLVPLAVVAVSGGVVVASRHTAHAQTPSSQQAIDKPEPGDQPDKPGQADPQDQPDTNGKADTETND